MLTTFMLRLRCACCTAALLLCGPAPAQELLVSAAASLSDAFKEIGTQFEARHAGAKVRFNLAASDVLLRQIVEGAPVDVFAAADNQAMDAAAARGAVAVDTRANFAGNRLVLAARRDSGVKLSGLGDLRQAAVKQIALSQPAAVPVGRYAEAALEQAQLWQALKHKLIFTQNVRQSLDYIARGEVDCGFVYATDAALLRDKVSVVLNVATPQPIVYPIAVTRRSAQPKLARAFVDFVRAQAGQNVLARYGFTKP